MSLHWNVHFHFVVAAYRKPLGGHSRSWCCSGLHHHLPQEENVKNISQQGWVTSKMLSLHSEVWGFSIHYYLFQPLFFIDGEQADVGRGTSKPRGENQQSPAKGNSRSPLRNATQDSNVRKNSSVEFREPLASYRYTKGIYQELFDIFAA